MNLFSQVRKFFLIISLVFCLGIFTAFTAEVSLAQTQIATTMNRVEATTKNIEGKVQETLGNVTGNKKDQFMGKAKQAESKVRSAVEDIKDAKWQPKSRAVTICSASSLCWRNLPSNSDKSSTRYTTI